MTPHRKQSTLAGYPCDVAPLAIREKSPTGGFCITT
jgi:hypothetical protein